MRVFIVSLLVYLTAGCSTLSLKGDFGFEDIASIKPNEANKKTILTKFGQPDKKETLPPEKGNFKEPIEYWGFKKGKVVRLHIAFANEKLQSIAYDIYEEDPEYDLATLLGKINGQYQIIKEPVRNPHSMPTKCYLVDEKKGISVLVNAFKKAPSFISFWNLEVGKDKKWFDDSTPEFCIAGHCSRVTDPDAWKHNHCEWLEKLVVKTKGTSKKSSNSKKTND